MELQLVVVAEPDGEPEAFHFPDFERVTLGRGPDSPVPLDGPSLSREHIRFELQNGALFVTDISSNGSSMNGKPLDAGVPREAKPGDEVGLAGYRIRMRLIAPEGDQSPAEATISEEAPSENQSRETTTMRAPETDSVETRPPEPPAPAPGFRLSVLEWVVVGLVAAVLGLIVVFFLY